MSAIRPGLPPTPPAQGLNLPSARSAQAAFFRAAADSVQPAPSAAVVSTVRTATPARPPEPLPTAPPREEPRILRPGSLLDIRI